MALNTIFKARKAMKLHNEGNCDEALKLYEECMNEGLKDMKTILPYSVLLLRSGQYQKARELLVSVQKYPMADDQKRQLFVNYAVAVYKLGDLPKAIEVLEVQDKKAESGLVYETLGYLLVEAGDFDKALEYNLKALEYDDEDPITLDNLGQTYFRLKGDKETARSYFDKALAQKPGQLDTLYFLAQYDIEAGNHSAAREKLETVRENIQAYHKLKLENIIDTNLERLDLIVDQRALEFKNLVTHKSDGNLIIMNRLLETAMVNRQEYMRSNMRNDMKLNNLYSQENARLSSIASWRVESTAEKEGVVSFYTDGYERFLNGDTIQSLTVSQVQKVLSGQPLGEISAREKDVYRLVNQNQWYVAILSDAASWTPVIDQDYYMQFEGFEDLGFSARVR